MMNLLIAKTPVNLAAHLTKLITAHQAVRQGIATHVQREHAARLDARRKMEADAHLKPQVRHHVGMLHAGADVCRDEQVRLLGCQVVSAGRVDRGRDLR